MKNSLHCKLCQASFVPETELQKQTGCCSSCIIDDLSKKSKKVKNGVNQN